jgi:hypothetical protein
MRRFEEYVRSITAGLDLSAADKERIQREALAHLEDEKARLVAEGRPAQEAETIALERFGDGKAVSKLMDDALAHEQSRHRTRRVLSRCAIAAGLLALVFVAGLNFLPLAQSLEWFAFSTDLGIILGYSLLLVVGGVVVSWLARVPWRVAAIAETVVFAVGGIGIWLLTSVLLRQPAAQDLVFQHWQGTASTHRMVFASIVGLYWHVTPTLVVGFAALILARGRRQGLHFVACTATALFGVAVFVAFAEGRYTRYGPEFAVAAASTVQFVLLAWLLAAAMRDRARNVGGICAAVMGVTFAGALGVTRRRYALAAAAVLCLNVFTGVLLVDVRAAMEYFGVDRILATLAPAKATYLTIYLASYLLAVVTAAAASLAFRRDRGQVVGALSGTVAVPVAWLLPLAVLRCTSHEMGFIADIMRTAFWVIVFAQFAVSTWLVARAMTARAHVAGDETTHATVDQA